MVQLNCRNHGGDAIECAVGEDIGGGGEKPDGWDRWRQRSLTSGPADVRGPPGSDGGEGNGHGPASRRTGPDGSTDLEWHVGIGPQGTTRRNRSTRIF
jgi:hypothetical protein